MLGRRLVNRLGQDTGHESRNRDVDLTKRILKMFLSPNLPQTLAAHVPGPPRKGDSQWLMLFQHCGPTR